MKTMDANVSGTEPRRQDSLAEPRHERNGLAEAQHERWAHCHVNWTAVWIGAMATFSMVLLFGLVGTALGAHLLTPEQRLVDVRKLALGTVIFSVFAAFVASALGGWVAGKVAGILHSEPAMLHGAFVWLVTVPILVVSAGLGVSSLFDSWYGGLGTNSAVNSTPFVRPDPLAALATPEEVATFRTQQAEYNRDVKQWHEDTPRVTRNSALVAVTALLLSLLGSVIGGWMASGEPMNFTHYRSRTARYHSA
jgi:ABC-type Fe3+ transport system permease subunit